MTRTRASLILIAGLLAAPRPLRAEPGGEFVGAINFEVLLQIQAQLKQVVQQIPQYRPDPIVVPVVGFGNKKAARYRFQRKDEVFYLDGDKRPVSIGWELSDVVETSGGTVERLLSVDGGSGLNSDGAKALSHEKQKLAREPQRLAKLLNDAEEKEKLQKKEREDESGLEKMVAEFPRALQFAYKGTERDASGEELIVETFESNDCSHTPHVSPCFTPSSQEARIYEGMRGEIWIRARDKHLVKFRTVIDHDVKFGWGIFSAKAKKGGMIAIALSDIDGSGRRWVISALEDHLLIEKSAMAALFTGGSERENDNQAMRGFTTVADMSFDQGIGLLLK